MWSSSAHAILPLKGFFEALYEAYSDEAHMCQLAHQMGCADSDVWAESSTGVTPSAKISGFLAIPKVSAAGKIIQTNVDDVTSDDCYYFRDYCHPDVSPHLSATIEEGSKTGVVEQICRPTVTYGPKSDLGACAYKIKSKSAFCGNNNDDCPVKTAPISGETYMEIPSPLCIPDKPYMPDILRLNYDDLVGQGILSLNPYLEKAINGMKNYEGSVDSIAILYDKTPQVLCAAVYNGLPLRPNQSLETTDPNDWDFSNPPDPLPICKEDEGKCCIPGVDCAYPEPPCIVGTRDCPLEDPGQDQCPLGEIKDANDKCCAEAEIDPQTERCPCQPGDPFYVFFDCNPPEIPNEFDCSNDANAVKSLFPASMIEGDVGYWSITYCDQSGKFSLEMQEKIKIHITCFENPSTSQVDQGADFKICDWKCGKTDLGLIKCLDPKANEPEQDAPICVSINPSEKGVQPYLPKPGYAKKGIQHADGSTTYTSFRTSHCVDPKTIEYPVCSDDSTTFEWQAHTCTPGFVCIDPNGPDDDVGAYCEKVVECIESDGGVEIITEKGSVDPTLTTNQCSGPSATNTDGEKLQAKKEIIEWECKSDDVNSFDWPSEPKPCPVGTACCYQKGKIDCYTNCPLVPVPDIVLMNYYCTDNDPTQDATVSGNVVISGMGVVDNTITTLSDYPDKCHGKNYLEQFSCAKPPAYTGAYGVSSNILLKSNKNPNSGAFPSCTEELQKLGMLAEKQKGECKPQSGGDICIPVDISPPPPPPEPGEPDRPTIIPEELDSFACEDTDLVNSNDPSGIGGQWACQSGIVSLPQLGYNQEDWCIDESYLIQYECSVDQDGEAIEKKIYEDNPYYCPNGCAQGKCCGPSGYSIIMELENGDTLRECIDSEECDY